MREYDFDPKDFLPLPPPSAKPLLKKESYLPKHIKRYENKLNNAHKSNPSKTTPSRGEENNNTNNHMEEFLKINLYIIGIIKYIRYLVRKAMNQHSIVYTMEIEEYKFQIMTNKEIKVYVKNYITQSFTFDQIIPYNQIKHIVIIDFDIFTNKYFSNSVNLFYLYGYMKYGENYICAVKDIMNMCIEDNIEFSFNIAMLDSLQPISIDEDEPNPMSETISKNITISARHKINTYLKITIDGKQIAEINKLTYTIDLDNVKEHNHYTKKLQKNIANTIIKIYNYNQYLKNKKDYDHIEEINNVFEELAKISELKVTPTKGNFTPRLPDPKQPRNIYR